MLSFEPRPALSSNSHMSEKATEQSRFFLKVKIHQVYGVESYQNSLNRLTVLVVDMGGNALRAVVWPPYCHDEIWRDGECVMILGAKVSEQYNQLVLNSDVVVLEDKAVAESDYPQDVTLFSLLLAQLPLPSSELAQ